MPTTFPLLAVHSTFCFSWISSKTKPYNRSKRQFSSHFLQWQKIMHTKQGLKKPKYLKTDNIHIEIDLGEDTHWEDLHEDWLSAFSSTISFLRYCCISCRPTLISRWSQNYQYYRFWCSCLCVIWGFWFWPVNLTKLQFFLTFLRREEAIWTSESLHRICH